MSSLSLGIITELHGQIIDVINRTVTWVHCPVPLNTFNDMGNFYAPLFKLAVLLASSRTRLYLVLIHSHNILGPRTMVQVPEGFVENSKMVNERARGGTLTQGEINTVLEVCRRISGDSRNRETQDVESPELQCPTTGKST